MTFPLHPAETARVPSPTPVQTRVTLPATLRAPSIARGLLGPHTRSLPASMQEDAAVLISEVVTNALLHGSPDITLVLISTIGAVRVAVHDTHPVLPHRPAPAAPAVDQPTGRGLHIIAALATRWGVTPTEAAGGKEVWFELLAADRSTTGNRQPAPTPAGRARRSEPA